MRRRAEVAYPRLAIEHSFVRAAGLMFLLVIALAVAPVKADELPADAIAVAWGGTIPMRDGVKLGVTVYRPRDAGPLPVIYMATPYIADSYHDRAMYFARHGYAFALVDVRGRGNSEGTFEPFLNDGRDGYDTVEWLASQSWSNGKVATWGGSYSGFTQWATVATRPPHLASIVPVASVHPGIDFPYYQNRMSSYATRWLTFTAGRTPNLNLFETSDVFYGAFRKRYTEHLPFASLDGIVGNPSPAFQLWLAHPTVDEFWDAMTPNTAQYASLDLPILTITGAYDDDQLGALAYYRNHLRAAGPAARDSHFLIIGPWDHPGTRTPQRRFGGLNFGERSLVDLPQLHRQWYDWTLKGGTKPEFLQDRVAYYVAGAGSDEWKYADSLESIANEERTFYLNSSAGRAHDVFQSGTLEPALSGASVPDRWVYDPLDTRPGLAKKPAEALSGYVSEFDALNLHGAGVVYHSPPFEKVTLIAGQPRATLFLAMDVPDTDIDVELSEILADGRSIQLSRASLRARYRESLREQRLVPAGRVLPYELKDFRFVSRRIEKGSRLRLVVSSTNSIHVQKNYNSGGVVAMETAQDARTAHIDLYHDRKYPSRVVLPVTNELSAAGAPSAQMIAPSSR